MEGTKNVQVRQLMSQIIAPAFFLVLLCRLKSLPSKVKLADMLGMDRRKVGRLINQLIDLGYVLANSGQPGYRLRDDLGPGQQQVVAFFMSDTEDVWRWFEELRHPSAGNNISVLKQTSHRSGQDCGA